MKRALALDMDDLIYPFVQSLVPFHNDRYQTDFGVEDYSTFEFSEVWGNTPEDAWVRVQEYFDHAHFSSENFLPLSGADVAVKELAEHYRLFIVTARADELEEATMTWLQQHFPDTFEGVFLCNSHTEDGRASRRTKLSVVEEIDAVGLVDDSPRHISEVANAGRLGLLFGDYPWNRNVDIPTTAQRVATWEQVVSTLLGDQV